MIWQPKEKAAVRRVLRALIQECEGGLATSMLHPQNGQFDAGPTSGLRSFLMTVAGVWGISLEKPTRSENVNEHQQPRKALKRRDKHVKANQHFGDDVSPSRKGRVEGVSRLRAVGVPKRLRAQARNAGDGKGVSRGVAMQLHLAGQASPGGESPI